MKISKSEINALFEQEDVEGLISQGAPSDEYSFEVDNIAVLLSHLSPEDYIEANILALIAAEWMQRFNLTEADMALRHAALQKIAQTIANIG